MADIDPLERGYRDLIEAIDSHDEERIAYERERSGYLLALRGGIGLGLPVSDEEEEE